MAEMSDYAEPHQRIFAYLIDLAIIWIPAYILMQIIPGLDKPIFIQMSTTPHETSALTALWWMFLPWAWGDALAGIVSFFYFSLFVSRSPKQATPGMAAMNIYLCTVDEEVVSFPRALLRYFISRFNTLFAFIGWLMIFFTPRGQGMHDLLTKTMVLKTSPFKASEGKYKEDMTNYVKPAEKYTPPLAKKDNSLEYYPENKDV